MPSSREIFSSFDSTSDMEGRSKALGDQHVTISSERLTGIRTLIGGLRGPNKRSEIDEDDLVTHSYLCPLATI